MTWGRASVGGRGDREGKAQRRRARPPNSPVGDSPDPRWTGNPKDLQTSAPVCLGTWKKEGDWWNAPDASQGLWPQRPIPLPRRGKTKVLWPMMGRSEGKGGPPYMLPPPATSLPEPNQNFHLPKPSPVHPTHRPTPPLSRIWGHPLTPFFPALTAQAPHFGG